MDKTIKVSSLSSNNSSNNSSPNDSSLSNSRYYDLDDDWFNQLSRTVSVRNGYNISPSELRDLIPKLKGNGRWLLSASTKTAASWLGYALWEYYNPQGYDDDEYFS